MDRACRSSNLPKLQKFSLPIPILHYASSQCRGYTKLIQTCKYFFEKHHILVLAHLTATTMYDDLREDYRDNEWCFDGHQLLNNDIRYSLVNKKLWITNSFTLKYDNLISSLRNYIYRYDVKKLVIYNYGGYNINLLETDISMNEIKFICIKNIRSFCLLDFTTIKISLNDILVLMPNCEEL